MAEIPEAPAVKDAVVVDGRKLRIQRIEGDWAVARASFHGPNETKRTYSLPVAKLTWDKVAGVWRLPQ